MLLTHVENSIRGHGLVPRGGRALIAVSGGVDSMVLLYVLHALSVKHGWKFTVAHFNHQLRGRSSEADTILVQKTAATLGLPLVVEHGNVKALLAKTGGLSLEMAARKLRHEFLARTAKKLGLSVIALAHHANHQVELFFLRLFRGAGGEGIAGMKWQSPSPVKPGIQLIRPLLDVPKADLEKFARENKIRFRHDATNASLDIRRNRIRHELLPLLKQHYQSAVVDTVLRTMEIVGAEADVITTTATKWLKLKRPIPFQRLPIAVQRRCLQLQLQRLNYLADFGVVELLRESAGVAVSLGTAATVSRDASGLVFLHTCGPVVFSDDEASVEVSGPAKSVVFGGLKSDWQIITTRGSALSRKHTVRLEFFDAQKVGERIVLRHWRPGDRFHPIGMTAPVKLQDWFVNQKIPRALRRKLVLAVAATGEIFWVQGRRISENFELTKSTKRRLKLSWSEL